METQARKLEIVTTELKRCYLVKLDGRIDSSAAPKVEEALKAIIDDQDKEAFQLIFFFLKSENFISDEDGNCKFDLFKKESLEKIEYIEKELKIVNGNGR